MLGIMSTKANKVSTTDRQRVAQTVVYGSTRSRMDLHGFAAPRAECLWLSDYLRQLCGSAAEA
jgi:hypothetical protein